MGIEVTDPYYNESNAKGTWDIARDKAKINTSKILLEPDLQLAQKINERISKKCNKRYEFDHPIILLVVTQPTLTEDIHDFQNNVLPHIVLPKHIQFSDIFLDLSFLSFHH